MGWAGGQVGRNFSSQLGGISS